MKVSVRTLFFIGSVLVLVGTIVATWNVLLETEFSISQDVLDNWQVRFNMIMSSNALFTSLQTTRAIITEMNPESDKLVPLLSELRILTLDTLQLAYMATHDDRASPELVSYWNSLDNETLWKILRDSSEKIHERYAKLLKENIAIKSYRINLLVLVSVLNTIGLLLIVVSDVLTKKNESK